MADDGYEVREIGPGVYIRQGVDNCVWADLGSGTLVIDTLEEAELAETIKEAVRATVGKPVKWVINTHWDGDHIAGNPTFAKEGATVIAHESCAERTDAQDGNPDITFTDSYILRGETVNGEDREAGIQWLGGTHTPADSVVYLPWARVLHVADLFGWGLFMQRGDTPEKTARTRGVLNELLRYGDMVDVVVCGHGPTLTMDHLRRYRDYFNTMWETVPALAGQGKTVEEIQAAVPVPDDMGDWWRLPEWKHNRNVERIVESLGG
jgi:glyoxylase-like metal-dependent hydrolase (beta-lactamase superfamily II)